MDTLVLKVLYNLDTSVTYEGTKKTQHASKLQNGAIHHLKIAWEYLRHLSETQIEFELHLRASHKRLLFPKAKSYVICALRAARTVLT